MFLLPLAWTEEAGLPTKEEIPVIWDTTAHPGMGQRNQFQS